MHDYGERKNINEAEAVAADHNDETVWLVNLKGLFNVLEAARLHNVSRIVHVGSAHSEHPKGVFYGSETRRPDGTLYATLCYLFAVGNLYVGI